MDKEDKPVRKLTRQAKIIVGGLFTPVIGGLGYCLDKPFNIIVIMYAIALGAVAGVLMLGALIDKDEIPMFSSAPSYKELCKRVSFLEKKLSESEELTARLQVDLLQGEWG